MMRVFGHMLKAVAATALATAAALAFIGTAAGVVARIQLVAPEAGPE